VGIVKSVGTKGMFWRARWLRGETSGKSEVGRDEGNVLGSEVVKRCGFVDT
jgi:hypothetical protein